MGIKVFIKELDTETPAWMSEHFTSEKSLAVEEAICARFQHEGEAGCIDDLIVLHKGDMHKGTWSGHVVEGHFSIEVDLGAGNHEYKIWTKSYFESKCQIFPGSDDVLGSFLAKDDADVAEQLIALGHIPEEYRWEKWN